MQIIDKHGIVEHESYETPSKLGTERSSETGSLIGLPKIQLNTGPFITETAILENYKLDTTKTSEPIKEVKGNKFNEGRWSKKEHQIFLEGLEKYGKNWKKIQDCVGTRSSTQARSHAQKYLTKLNRAKNAMSGRNSVQPKPLAEPRQKDLTVGTQSITPFVSPMYKPEPELLMLHDAKAAKRLIRFDELTNEPKQKCKVLDSNVRPMSPLNIEEEVLLPDLDCIELEAAKVHDISIVELKTESRNKEDECKDVLELKEVPDTCSWFDD